MELILIMRVLLRRWYLILIPVVIVTAFTLPDLLNMRAGAAGGFSTMLRYTAAQQLEAIPNRDGDFQDVWLASELTVNAFTEWVRTGSFAQEVAQAVALRDLEIDPTELAIAADNERSIGQIFINWPDSDELETIAWSVIDVLQARNQDYFPQLGDAPAQIRVLDTPQITAAPPSLPNRFRPLIQIVLALLAGMGVAFLVEYLDPTLRQREDVEILGVRVIANIPRE